MTQPDQTRRRVNVPHAGAAPVRIDLDQTLWTAPGSVPSTHAELFWDRAGLTCRITAVEDDPLTRHLEPNSPVHLDSCVEFFLAPWPHSGHYLNLEANSAGTLYAAFGTTDRRDLLTDHQRGLVGADAEKTTHQWSVTFTVSGALLTELARMVGRPAPALTEGTRLQGNVYKCGDQSPVEHYGAWNPIAAPTPQFHRPDQFGDLVLAG